MIIILKILIINFSEYIKLKHILKVHYIYSTYMYWYFKKKDLHTSHVNFYYIFKLNYINQI